MFPTFLRAIQTNQQKEALRLFRQHPSLAAQTDENGNTALISAIKANNIDLFTLLLQNRHCNINSADREGKSALHHTISLKRKLFFERLIADARANLFHLDAEGLCVAHSAIVKDHMDILRAVIPPMLAADKAAAAAAAAGPATAAAAVAATPRTPLGQLGLLELCITEDKPEALQYLLTMGVPPADPRVPPLLFAQRLASQTACGLEILRYLSALSLQRWYRNTLVPQRPLRAAKCIQRHMRAAWAARARRATLLLTSRKCAEMRKLYDAAPRGGAALTQALKESTITLDDACFSDPNAAQYPANPARETGLALHAYLTCPDTSAALEALIAAHADLAVHGLRAGPAPTTLTLEAVLRGDLTTVKLILAHQPDVLWHTVPCPTQVMAALVGAPTMSITWEPLFVAAALGQVEIVETLFPHHPDGSEVLATLSMLAGLRRDTRMLTTVLAHVRALHLCSLAELLQSRALLEAMTDVTTMGGAEQVALALDTGLVPVLKSSLLRTVVEKARASTLEVLLARVPPATSDFSLVKRMVPVAAALGSLDKIKLLVAAVGRAVTAAVARGAYAEAGELASHCCGLEGTFVRDEVFTASLPTPAILFFLLESGCPLSVDRAKRAIEAFTSTADKIKVLGVAWQRLAARAVIEQTGILDAWELLGMTLSLRSSITATPAVSDTGAGDVTAAATLVPAGSPSPSAASAAERSDLDELCACLRTFLQKHLPQLPLNKVAHMRESSARDGNEEDRFCATVGVLLARSSPAATPVFLATAWNLTLELAKGCKTCRDALTNLLKVRAALPAAERVPLLSPQLSADTLVNHVAALCPRTWTSKEVELLGLLMRELPTLNTRLRTRIGWPAIHDQLRGLMRSGRPDTKTALRVVIVEYFPEVLQCAICGEVADLVQVRRDAGGEHFRKTKCAHEYCAACLKTWMESKINEGLHHLSCPDPDCSFVLYNDDVKALVAAPAFERYRQTLQADFEERLILVAEDPEMSAFVADSARRCPSCFVIIYRYEGCNSMLCTCGSRFTWDSAESRITPEMLAGYRLKGQQRRRAKAQEQVAAAAAAAAVSEPPARKVRTEEPSPSHRWSRPTSAPAAPVPRTAPHRNGTVPALPLARAARPGTLRR